MTATCPVCQCEQSEGLLCHDDTTRLERELGDEEWRSVPGYEALYEVSDRGRVRSMPRQGTPGRIVRPRYNVEGYADTKLCTGGVCKTYRTHVLVAMAWHGPRPERYVCRHLDDDKTNNVPSNLAWGTRSDNQLDAVRNDIHSLAKRDACANDHPFTPENTRWTPRKDRRPYRQCRPCLRINDARYRASRGAA